MAATELIRHEFDCCVFDMCEDMLIKSLRLIDNPARSLLARMSFWREPRRFSLTINDAWLGRYFLLIVQLALI
jgi:hypothetical protein